MPALLRPARVFSALVVLTILAACTDDPSTAPRQVPRGADRFNVPIPSAFSHVSAGVAHSCAVRVTGVIECWGDDSKHQAPGARAAASGSFTAVSAGSSHTCALRGDGVIECWGDNTNGQAPATKTASSSSFTQVSAGGSHTCARRADGVVECWGDNSLGAAPPSKTATTGSFTQVSAGYYHTCALRADGAVECWGYDEGGSAPATKTATTGSFTQVSVNYVQSCASRSDGVVECWGSNTFGQAPATVTPAAGGFTQVSVGAFHACGLRSDGVVQCWGRDAGVATATKTAATGSYTEVDAGDFHNCARRSDGAVECWGADFAGQAPPVRAPGTTVIVVPIADFNRPSTVSAGQSFTLSFTNANVPGHPEATSFKYAFNCGDGSGWGAVSTTSSASCPTSTTGTRNVAGQLIDQDNVVVTYFGTVEVGPPSDVTPPVIAATITGTLGTNGWYKSNVTVSWTVTDAESAITSPACASVTITTDTNGQTVSCSATSIGGTDSKSVTIKRDATAPVLAPTVAPSTVLLNGTGSSVSPHTSDATSGVLAATCGTVITTAVGSQTLSCSAIDNAGNSASAQATYIVTYDFSGFSAPLEAGGVLNTVKAGQLIPLKWRLLDAAEKPVTTLAVATVTVATLSCAAGTSASALAEFAAAVGGSGLQNLGNGYYQLSVTTPKNYAGSCKTMHLNMGEGITRTVLFQFR